MNRITITIDDDLMAELDRFMERHDYANRSEAFRDILREKVKTEQLRSTDDSHCIACLSFVYDHHERELSQRLTRAQHDHHDLNVSALHVHLDHDNCIEALILKGPVEGVRRFAQSVTTQRGVRHGNLHLVPLDVELGGHSHGGDPDDRHTHWHHTHWHGRPRT